MSWDFSLETDVDGGAVDLPETWRNYTHNCNPMVRDAGLEEWPHRIDGWSAERLSDRLGTTLATLEADPDRYRSMNPENGWGKYDSLLVALRDVRASCEEYPSATVRMSV